MGEELAALSPYHSQLNVGPPESCQSSGEFLHSPSFVTIDDGKEVIDDDGGADDLNVGNSDNITDGDDDIDDGIDVGIDVGIDDVVVDVGNIDDIFVGGDEDNDVIVDGDDDGVNEGDNNCDEVGTSVDSDIPSSSSSEEEIISPPPQTQHAILAVLPKLAYR